MGQNITNSVFPSTHDFSIFSKIKWRKLQYGEDYSTENFDWNFISYFDWILLAVPRQPQNIWVVNSSCIRQNQTQCYFQMRVLWAFLWTIVCYYAPNVPYNLTCFSRIVNEVLFETNLNLFWSNYSLWHSPQNCYR